MKKKLFIMALVVCCFSILAYGTAAYFTADDIAHNIITTGSVNIKLVEKQKVGNVIVDYPEEPIRVMPATNVSKIVTVESLGESAYIRVSLKFVFKDSNKNEYDLTAKELDALVSVNINTDDWIDQDGYYYYEKPLSNGASTTVLFDTVSFNGPNMTNEYQNSTLEIIVKAEAVQSVNNGSDPTKASGWKTEKND